jgi:hypothetical protein
MGKHRRRRTWRRWAWRFALPLAITLAYRLIPRRVRGLWKRHQSTSHLALAGIRAGHGWDAVRAAVAGWKGEGGGPHP